MKRAGFNVDYQAMDFATVVSPGKRRASVEGRLVRHQHADAGNRMAGYGVEILELRGGEVIRWEAAFNAWDVGNEAATRSLESLEPAESRDLTQAALA